AQADNGLDRIRAVDRKAAAADCGEDPGNQGAASRAQPMSFVRRRWWMAFLLPWPLAAQQGARKPVEPVRVMMEAGRLDDAERAARAGGDADAVTLGDVLV